MKPDRKAADPVRASVTRRAFLKKGGMLAGLAAAGPGAAARLQAAQSGRRPVRADPAAREAHAALRFLAGRREQPAPLRAGQSVARCAAARTHRQFVTAVPRARPDLDRHSRCSTHTLSGKRRPARERAAARDDPRGPRRHGRAGLGGFVHPRPRCQPAAGGAPRGGAGSHAGLDRQNARVRNSPRPAHRPGLRRSGIERGELCDPRRHGDHAGIPARADHESRHPAGGEHPRRYRHACRVRRTRRTAPPSSRTW